LIDLNHFIEINDKIKKIKQKIIGSFEAFCDLYDTFNWYSNQFYSLLTLLVPRKTRFMQSFAIL